MAAFKTEPFDVSAGRLGNPEAVQREQRDQSVVARVAEPGGDEHGPDLVAVQAGGVRFVVETRSSDVHRR